MDLMHKDDVDESATKFKTEDLDNTPPNSPKHNTSHPTAGDELADDQTIFGGNLFTKLEALGVVGGGGGIVMTPGNQIVIGRHVVHVAGADNQDFVQVKTEPSSLEDASFQGTKFSLVN